MKVLKYDAGRKVYYDVEIEDLEKEYKSLRMTKKEIAPKIDAAREDIAAQIAKLLGVEKVNIEKDKTGNIKVEVE